MYPLSWFIITVRPNLGSFFILATVPAAAAFTTVVLSALISTPLCVIHSCKVFENTNVSFANSLKISPFTGASNSTLASFFSIVAFVDESFDFLNAYSFLYDEFFLSKF